jgi:Family of unknown function (DUF6498)
VERLVRLYRHSSSRVALAVLVAVNLIPLVGVLFKGWDLWSILILYWLENGIVGVINVVKILLAAGTSSGAATKAVIVPFFIVHYGLFWVVHGAFVLAVLPLLVSVTSGAGPSPIDVGPFGAIPGDDQVTADPMWDVVLGAAVGLAISHLVSFFLNFVGRREYRTTTPVAQASAPYARVVVLHVTILFGALLTAALGNPVWALVVLVGLKMALDLALHLREHRTAVSRVPATTARDPLPGAS